jgi:hypothetical protein
MTMRVELGQSCRAAVANCTIKLSDVSRHCDMVAYVRFFQSFASATASNRFERSARQFGWAVTRKVGRIECGLM